MPLPGNWLEVVNKPQTDRELEALRRSVVRGTPYGSESWVKAVVYWFEIQLARPNSPQLFENWQDRSLTSLPRPLSLTEIRLQNHKFGLLRFASD
jgi:hypothetical protein